MFYCEFNPNTVYLTHWLKLFLIFDLFMDYL